MKINIDGEKIIGIFKRRVNRFIAEIYLNNKIETVHVANTGRMKELLVPGAKVVLRKSSKIGRKTEFDLLMVYKDNTLVSIDSRLPNSLLYVAFKNKKIPYFKEYEHIKREVTFGKSKLDFYIANELNAALIEAKCVTLVKENNLATFPDAPTERGKKHIDELIEAKKQGFRTAVFFIIQRNDATLFMPNQDMDPPFSDAVKRAKKEGVEFYAYNCNVTMDSIEINKEIKIII